jgi:hypothetical protein
MDANERRDLPNGEQRAVRVGTCAVPGVVTDRQLLIRHPEDDLGAYHVAGQPNRVNLRARNGGATGLSRADCLRQRNRRLRGAHFRQPKRKFARPPPTAQRACVCRRRRVSPKRPFRGLTIRSSAVPPGSLRRSSSETTRPLVRSSAGSGVDPVVADAWELIAPREAARVRPCCPPGQ